MYNMLLFIIKVITLVAIRVPLIATNVVYRVLGKIMPLWVADLLIGISATIFLPVTISTIVGIYCGIIMFYHFLKGNGKKATTFKLSDLYTRSDDHIEF